MEALFHKLWKARVVWESIVTIRLGRRSHTVKSSRQAFELLTKHWPTSDGRAYISALEACQGVEVGTVMENDALGVFLLALREANIRFTLSDG
ncbi:DUF982 domain-containing protein [Rhizobium sp. LjRoot258]|uniref:DUF982 domain-containing protein n=1 Tax=Rhizobium sp. LjRoot258 TaxID=3342299 RepID=UPI003F507E67